MDDKAWVIVWVRTHTDYPTITSNIADEKTAKEMVREMLTASNVGEIITACPASKLRELRP